MREIRRAARRSEVYAVALLLCFAAAADSTRAADVALRGAIRDAQSGQPLAARLYLRSGDQWYFARSASPEGSAVEYRKTRADGESVEMHTTLSAHPFIAQLPPGEYTLTVERGKEYLPATKKIKVKEQPLDVSINLRRWIDMAGRGWYSGDTHVHRRLDELPNVVAAEDLNVALPLTGWVRTSEESPLKSYSLETGRIAHKLIEVDKTHVIYPLNTEWEIFSVGKQRHTLGAVFALGHREPFDLGVPPVRRVAAEARRQGALLELDKHNWPWSMMIVPVMNVDLFELSNNHIWRTRFAFTSWYPEYAAAYMKLEMNDAGFTEWGWINFGFQNYYTLLNCGFRMRPTAGTASGVHPVPLGFGRVYVELPDGFSYDAWMRGLNAGRSFVTTGPMIFVRANNQPAGHTFKLKSDQPARCQLAGAAESPYKLDRIEVVVNGEIVETIKPSNDPRGAGGFGSTIDHTVMLDGSSWVAVRCFYRETDGRIRFAHTSPFHFDVPGKPLRPRKAETAYLIKRIEDELARHRDVLPEAALDEYREALDFYRKLHEQAR